MSGRAASRVQLVGRSAERAALWKRASTPGVLTLLGTPGVGKTALARALFARWRGRACWVDLTEARALAELRAAVARGLGLQGARAPDSVERCLERQGPMLLVLDNFEQLLPAGAAVPAGWAHEA